MKRLDVQIFARLSFNRPNKIPDFTFKAIGCADLEMPPGVIFKQTNQDEAVVSCTELNSHWSLSCENNQWKGLIGNCSHGKLQQ